MNASKYGMTVATCVCCSMISETQTRYGVGSRCHGRSLRPSLSNHASTLGAKDSSAFTCAPLDVVEQFQRRSLELVDREAPTDERGNPEIGDEFRLVCDAGRLTIGTPGRARDAAAQIAALWNDSRDQRMVASRDAFDALD